MSARFEIDAYAPAEIAARVTTIGVVKARLPFTQMTLLGVLGGAFIALGALYYALVTSDASLAPSAARVLGGVVFSLGLVLVVVAGAELFTGNNLLVTAWASRAISTRDLARNWSIVYITNALGAAGIAWLAVAAGLGTLDDDAVARHIVRIAEAKIALTFGQAFAAGILCNVLVCLGVWLAMAGRSVTDKIIAIVLPISAFVAAGFEHSVANFFFFAMGWAYRDLAAVSIDAGGIIDNLVPVTLGNIVGGGLLVGSVYFLIYRPGNKQ